jgi:hypothetical protein
VRDELPAFAEPVQRPILPGASSQRSPSFTQLAGRSCGDASVVDLREQADVASRVTMTAAAAKRTRSTPRTYHEVSVSIESRY